MCKIMNLLSVLFFMSMNLDVAVATCVIESPDHTNVFNFTIGKCTVQSSVQSDNEINVWTFNNAEYDNEKNPLVLVINGTEDALLYDDNVVACEDVTMLEDFKKENWKKLSVNVAMNEVINGFQMRFMVPKFGGQIVSANQALAKNSIAMLIVGFMVVLFVY
ncbi:hypothetical protein M3Y96_01138700 [Aphelenchoides besseyi]|nr:hypothetical protein M3Y96_01138700 [Aphelenchoides besseyi]